MLTDVFKRRALDAGRGLRKQGVVPSTASQVV